MSKNYIIAKAMLAGLGIYGVAAFSCRFADFALSGNFYWHNLLIYLGLFFVFCRFLIFHNDVLARRISGDYSSTEDFVGDAYLIKSFRISFVIVGLCLLCSDISIFNIAGVIKLVIDFSMIRNWEQIINQTGDFAFSKTLFISLIRLFNMCIIAYLLCGGGFLIRWHLRKLETNIDKELTNE